MRRNRVAATYVGVLAAVTTKYGTSSNKDQAIIDDLYERIKQFDPSVQKNVTINGVEMDLVTSKAIIEVKSNNGQGLAEQIAKRVNNPLLNPEDKVVIGYAPRISRFAAGAIERAGGIAAGARTTANPAEVEEALETLLDVIK